MMPYLLVSRGTYRESGQPFVQYFQRAGSLFIEVTSDPTKAKEFLTIHSAKRMIKEHGLRRFKPERISTRRDGPVLREVSDV